MTPAGGWPLSEAETTEMRRREQLAKDVADMMDRAFPNGCLEDKVRILRMAQEELGSRQS
jgi:hypothetical protein